MSQRPVGLVFRVNMCIHSVILVILKHPAARYTRCATLFGCAKENGRFHHRATAGTRKPENFVRPRCEIFQSGPARGKGIELVVLEDAGEIMEGMARNKGHADH